MKKLFRIEFFKDQFGIKGTFKSKILFDNEQTAQQVADKIAKERKLFWQLEELYL